MAHQTITEAARGATPATPVDGKPGRFLIQLIDAGWGASGYYSADVLEAAAKAKVWPKGTHMYLDHPHADGSGIDDRGNRSVKDLAAVLDEDARYDATLGSLVAETEVFSLYREPLSQMADSIGVSVRAFADASYGEAEGRRGLIVSELVEGRSVDFVTKAGRGGKILQVIESARAAQEGATANDTRDALDAALTDEYGGEKVWVYVRDFDDTNVWYRRNDDSGDSDLFQLAYTIDDGLNVTFSGTPIEVRVQTTYVPVAADSNEPDGDTTVDESSATTPVPGHPAGQSTNPKEPTMGTIQVDEADYRRVTEAAGRVQTLESERDAAVTRAETAESERDAAVTRAETAESTLATRDRGVAIAKLLKDATESAGGVELNEFERAGIVSRAVIKDGVLDESATSTAFNEAVAKVAESHGKGRPRGLGGKVASTVTDTATVDESVFDELDALAFGAIATQEA